MSTTPDPSEHSQHSEHSGLDPRLDDLEHPAYATPAGPSFAEMVLDRSALQHPDVENYARMTVLGRRAAGLDPAELIRHLEAQARTALLFYFDTFGEPAPAGSLAYRQAEHVGWLAELLLDEVVGDAFEAILPDDLRERVSA